MSKLVRPLTTNPKRMLLLLLGLVLLAFAASLCYRYTRTTLLAFTVRDAETGELLPDTLLEVQNVNGQTLHKLVTDENGWAGIKRMVPGENYRVVARHIDYVPAEKRNVEVKLHQTVNVVIPLRPKPGGRLFVATERAYVAAADTASYLFTAVKQVPFRETQQIVQLVAHPTLFRLYVLGSRDAYTVDGRELEASSRLPITGTVTSLALIGGGEQLAALASDGNRSRIVILDATTLETKQVLPLPVLWSSRARAIFAKREERVYILGGMDYYIDVVERSSGELYRLPMRFRPTWYALSADEGRLFVGSSTVDRMLVIDTATAENINSVPIGQGITAIAVHPTRPELYLANAQLGLLTILDSETLETLAHVPVGRRPTIIHVDAAGERVYVANLDSKDISVMDVASREIIETIDVGVRITALDSATRR